MNIYCPNCENACSEFAAICPKCGHPLAAPITQPPMVEAVSSPLPQSSKPAVQLARAAQVARRPTGPPICGVCGAGALSKRVAYRLGVPGALIGWLILVPSFLGTTLSVLVLAGSYYASSAVISEMSEQDERALKDVPEELIEKARTFALTDAERRQLSVEQRIALDNLTFGPLANFLGAGLFGMIVGVPSVCLGFASLLGCLFGWLLTLKKKILKCNGCGAVVAAS